MNTVSKKPFGSRSKPGTIWVMICHRVASIDEVHRTLGKLPPAQIDRALESVARTKAKLRRRTHSRNPLSGRSTGAFGICAWRSWARKKRAKRSPEDGKRSPVETY